MTRSIEQLLEEGELRASPNGIATKTTLLLRNGNVLAISGDPDNEFHWMFRSFCFVGFGWLTVWIAPHRTLGWVAGFAFILSMIAAFSLSLEVLKRHGKKPEERAKGYKLMLVMGEDCETLFESADRSEVELVRDEIERQLGTRLNGD